MSDVELAALERAAREKGDATALRYARALERLGRPEREILAALALGRDDVDVRRALVARTSEAIPRRVRERWTVELPGPEPTGALHPTPLGIACVTRRRIVLLHPDTGKARFVRLTGETFVAGTVLLVVTAAGRVVGRDLWTGESLFSKKIKGETKIEGLPRLLFYGHGSLVTGEGNDVFVYRFADERRAPRLAWRIKKSWGSNAAAGPRLVAVNVEKNVFAAHDAATGDLRWRAIGLPFRSDEHGVVVLDMSEPRMSLIAYDLEGRRAWARLGPFIPEFPLRDDGALVVVEATRPPKIKHYLDRITGEPITDDRLFLSDETFPDVGARTALGEQAWTWALPEDTTEMGLISSTGLVYVAVGHHRITCLEEDA